MPLTPEQNKQLDDALFATLNTFTPPLKTGERDGMNASFGEIVDSYTIGETPPVEGDWQELKWPPAGGYTRQETSFPAKFKVTVPAGTPPGQGRVQVAPAATYDTHNSRTLVVAATPGGAPMSTYSKSGPSKTPNVPYWIGPVTAQGYPEWKPGSSYYITVESGVGKEDKGTVDLYYS